jgi:hypothetical protein
VQQDLPDPRNGTDPDWRGISIGALAFGLSYPLVYATDPPQTIGPGCPHPVRHPM